MKAKVLLKFPLMFGMAILAFVLWTATTPVNADAKSLIGGWEFVPWGTCCWEQSEEDCGLAVYGCDYGDYGEVCLYGTGEGSCEEDPYGGYPCYGNATCRSAHDTLCIGF